MYIGLPTISPCGFYIQICCKRESRVLPTRCKIDKQRRMGLQPTTTETESRLVLTVGAATAGGLPGRGFLERLSYHWSRTRILKHQHLPKKMCAITSPMKGDGLRQSIPQLWPSRLIVIATLFLPRITKAKPSPTQICYTRLVDQQC